jgi:alpha-tubulin suppressor-like RCC1 family protein
LLLTGFSPLFSQFFLFTYISDSGDVFSCGFNGFGQCGIHGEDFPVRSPFSRVSFPEGVKLVEIRCGEHHSLALDDSGRIWAFGSNADHQLAQPVALKFSSAPVLVDILPAASLLSDGDSLSNESELQNENSSVKAKQLSCGARHSLCLDALGFGTLFFNLEIASSNVYCLVYGWGWSGYMQLGQNEMDDVESPKLIDLPEPIVEVCAGTWHSLFLGGTELHFFCICLLTGCL